MRLKIKRIFCYLNILIQPLFFLNKHKVRL